MKYFLLMLFVLTLLALAFLPAGVLGFAGPAFEIPQVLYAALIGFISVFVTQGLKDRFPQIADALAILVSAVVTTVLDLLAGAITTGVPFEFWPLLTQGFLLLASWLTAWGSYRLFFRKIKGESLTPLRSAR